MTNDDYPCLEIVLLEVQLRVADFISRSFETNLLEAIEADGGRLLFNERLIGDARYQRAAAVRFSQNHSCIVFLTHDGQSVLVEDTRESTHPIVERVLACNC